MTKEIRAWVEQAIKEHDIGGKTLEIGSLDVNGGVRDLFEDYIGIDQVEGKGVDLVMDANYLHGGFKPDLFDTVLCLEVLEHDKNFHATLSGIEFVLKEGGYLILSTPANGFPIHRYPKDYWRFNEDAYREVLLGDGWNIIKLETIPSGGYEAVICLAKKIK